MLLLTQDNPPHPKRPKSHSEHVPEVNGELPTKAATGSNVSAPSSILDAAEILNKKLQQQNATLQENLKTMAANQKSFVKVNADLTAQLQRTEAKSKQVESGKLGKLTKKDQVSFVCFWV